MKKIEAFIPPFVLDDVRLALAELRVDVVRVLPAEELTDATQHTENYQGVEYDVDSSPRVLLVVLARDHEVDSIVARIQASARTDHQSAGRIVVTSVEQHLEITPNPTGDRIVPAPPPEPSLPEVPHLSALAVERQRRFLATRDGATGADSEVRP